MYDAALVLQRFQSEVQRLKSLKVVRSVNEIETECGIGKSQLSKYLKGKTLSLSSEMMQRFVKSYRRHGVSYEYILEGHVPGHALHQIKQEQLIKVTKHLKEALKGVEELRKDGNPI